MSTATNPLFNAPNVNQPPPPGVTGQNILGLSPVQAPPAPGTSGGGDWGNPGGLANPGSNLKDAMRNAGENNVVQGQQRSQLVPEFSNAMFSAAGPAADFFKQLMNLGSPYYQQQQRASEEEGVEQASNAAATARQQTASSGMGRTGSGADVASIGEQGIAESQNLSQMYLQNLFQNENLQMQASQGLAGLAGLFNPSSLFGNTTVSGSTQGPTATSQIKDIASMFSVGGSLGGAQVSAGGGKG